MSGGRRTQTFTLNNNDKRRAANSYPALGGAGNFRGLKKSDLAGAIFGCTHQTFKECVTQFIFAGLPAPHFAYVQNISPGLPLCLFNYSNRKMHGVFEAASYGQMNINPYAWTAFGSEKTQFPAQVRVYIGQHFEPLPEAVFRKAINANYYTNTHFWFELNHAQTEALMAIFFPRPAKMYSQIGSSKVAENGSWLSKRDTSSSNGWQTGSSPDNTEVASDLISLGDWPIHSTKCKKVPHGEEYSWQVDSESSSKNKVKYKSTTSSSFSSHEQSLEGLKKTNSEVEMNSMDEAIKRSHILAKQVHESTGRGSNLYKPVINSKKNLELHVLEKLKHLVKLKHLAINRQGSRSNLTSDLVVYGDNVVCHLENDTEKSTHEKLHQNLETLKNERERLLSSLSSVDASMIDPLKKYLEIHASIVAQMQQEITELRCCVEKTRNEFQNSFEIQELLKKNTLMEQKQRFALAGAVLGGALYALGGFDGKQYLKSVERFDPREGPWVQLEEMSSKRGSLSTAVLNEKIYAIGGFDGSNFLSSVEVFDPRAGSWLMVDSTVSPRAYGAAAVIGDSIYIIGGFGEKDFVDSVESYQDGVGWQVSSQSMCKRSFLTAVVL